MQPVLGKWCCGKDALVYGLEICLAKAGLKAHAVTAGTAAGCDILLCSLFWYHDVYALEAFLRRSGIRKGTGKPWIIAGGMQATMTPEVVAEFVDYVFVGDGDDHLGDIVHDLMRDGHVDHPYVYSSGMSAPPPPAECAPTAFGVTTQGDEGGVLRVEIARGCKFKCPFCCLSNLKPYREVDFKALEPLIKAHAGQRVSFFAPEVTCHSEWGKIKSALKKHGCTNLGQDSRLENLEHFEGHSVNIGIEGISPRLGKLVGKPFTHEFILEKMERYIKSRKHRAMINAYFIADLPGECEEDWAEIWALFKKMSAAEWSRQLTFVPILNPFSPKPFTRLSGSEIHIFRDYPVKWLELLRNRGSQWGFPVVETMVWSPYRRLLDAIVQRGGRIGAKLIKALPNRLLGGYPPRKDQDAVMRQILSKLAEYGLMMEELETGKAPEKG